MDNLEQTIYNSTIRELVHNGVAPKDVSTFIHKYSNQYDEIEKVNDKDYMMKHPYYVRRAFFVKNVSYGLIYAINHKEDTKKYFEK